MNIGEFIRRQDNNALAVLIVKVMEIAEDKLIENNGLPECYEVSRPKEQTEQNIEAVLQILNQPYQEE